MKIKEVIVEGSPAKIAKRLQQSTVGLNLLRDAEFADRIYELNRVMMAAAMADGKNPLQIPRRQQLRQLKHKLTLRHQQIPKLKP